MVRYLIEHRRELTLSFLFFLSLALFVLALIYAPTQTAALIILLLLLWTYRTAQMVFYATINYAKIKASRLTDWQEESDRLENFSAYKKYLAAELVKINSASDPVRHWLQRPFLQLSKRSQSYAKYRRLLARYTRVASANPAQVLRPSTVWHLVVIPCHRETFATLSASLDSLVRQRYDLSRLYLVLAGEARDASFDTTFRLLEQRFGTIFPHFLSTKHVLLPTETGGKASNIRYGVLQARDILLRDGIDLGLVIVTSTDADAIFTPDYLSVLTYNFCLDTDRDSALFRGTVLFIYNYSHLRYFSRAMATLITVEEISKAESRYIHPQSTFSLSFTSLTKIGFWDPTVMSDDEHIYHKMFMEYGSRFHMDALHEIIYLTVPNDTKSLQSVRSLYNQMLRWNYGTVFINKSVLTDYALNPMLTLKERILSTYDKFERLMLLPFYSLMAVFSATLIHFIRSSFRPYEADFIHRIVLSLSITNLALLALITILDYVIRRTEPFGRLRPGGEILNTLRWLFIPVISIYIGFLPFVDTYLRIAFGKKLEFKSSIKNERQQPLRGIVRKKLKGSVATINQR